MSLGSPLHAFGKVETAEALCASAEKLFLVLCSPRLANSARLAAEKAKETLDKKARMAVEELEHAVTPDVVKIAELEAWRVN